MQGSLKNKLLQFEAVPPPGVWEEISIQLNEAFVAGDSQLAIKIKNLEVLPPAGMFERIGAGLYKAPPVNFVPMYRRMAIAAAIIGLVILGAVNFFNDHEIRQDLADNNLEKTPVIRDTTNELKGSLQPDPGSTVKELLATLRPTRSAITKKEPANTRNAYRVSLLSQDVDIDDPKPVQMVNTMEPVQVAAPPIKDSKGNVIMDASIISSPNEPYITVTSPNGSQTKISNKFLSCLSYLNGDYSASEINYEGQQWKSRFAEWRNKLSEAGFVPGANNFFDIFELQELIRD